MMLKYGLMGLALLAGVLDSIHPALAYLMIPVMIWYAINTLKG